MFAVKTYVATDSDSFERHMYHSADCLNSLKQGKMTCSGCGAEVEKATAVKGTEANGKIVLISDDEVKAQQPMGDKSMRILEYVDEAEINPVFYEDAEFVVPDKGGEVPFAMLQASLKRTGKVAKGVRVKGGKEQYFTLRPYGQNGMTMHYLRADHEVRDCNQWTPVAVNGEMVEMFSDLIEAQTVKFTPAPQDKFLANVRKLVAAKANGSAVECPTVEEEQTATTDDLLEKMKAALANAAKAGK